MKKNNEIIAKFLGYSQPHPDYPSTTYWYKEGKAPLTILLFDSSWDWLMDVVENIETIQQGRYQVDILQEGCKILDRCSIIVDKTVGKLESNTSKINAVYQAVIEFINEQNNKK